jgi:DNA-binding XRE family transcriptional regulator
MSVKSATTTAPRDTATSPPQSRRALVVARTRLGWRQEDAAEQVSVSVSTWSRWERGDLTPRAPARGRIARAFGVSLDEVDRWLNGADEPSAWPWAGPWVLSTTDTVEVVGELWRWDVHPSRRNVLATLPFLPTVLGDWLLSWSLDPGAESRAHRGAGPSVGMEDVHRVHDAIDAFSQMDHRFGGGLVRPAVVDYLHSHIGPLLRGRYTDEVGAALLSAAAAMTALAGWEAYDLLQHGLAQEYYGQALRLSKVADDPLTSAWVLTMLAQQAIDRHEASWARRLARAATQAGEQADAAPRVRAGLLLREARATALGVDLADTPDAHQARRVQRLLGRAEQAIADAGPGDDEPAWIHDLGPAEFAAEAGCTWRMVGEHDRAATCADKALAGFGSAFPRSTQFNKIHKAQALLRRGDLDEALAAAHGAIPAANSLTSRRTVELIREFDQELTPHAAELQVRNWRECLRTELRPSAA